jgi:hypothetical protein
MEKKPLVWKADGSSPDNAFSAQLGNLITYHAVTRTYGCRPTLSCAVRAVV